MATTNDESWMAWINRMYRDEEAYWNRLRFREVPQDNFDKGAHDGRDHQGETSSTSSVPAVRDTRDWEVNLGGILAQSDCPSD